ncbi:MAG: hypothetical protein LBV17_01030 [Treponema sp.]|jgi:hypothetical protein|nr:hypothetical protein [Treponema sp.]
MKRIWLFIAVIFIINQGIFCQDSEKKWTIQTNPLLLFSDIFIDDINDTLFIMDLEFQRKISESSNVSITLSFLYSDLTVWGNDWDNDYDSHKETVYQIGFKPMYINRPFETGLKGFFIGVYPNIGFRNTIIYDTSKFYTELGFGLNVGYKWVFNSGFTMQVGGGIGKTFSIPPKKNHDSFVNSDGRITIIHSDLSLFDFKLGYSF